MTDYTALIEATHITLDGRPARIVGKRLSYPVVVRLDDGYRAEFSWTTVNRVVAERNGAFKS